MAQRKVPLRKCVVTREMKPKQELIRVVRNKEGDIFVDESGKKNGRGAYITKDAAVIEQARKQNTLASQLKAKVDDQLYEDLLAVVKGKEIG